MIGRTLGAYRIVARLGEGGMGEVYRARDTKLGRDVALKTLPANFAQDAERLARFRREAQVLAALNHPHIGGIYGLEETNGCHFLVLELIEGETLSSRLAHGPLPIDEALVIARQIAEALAAAHDRGIVHRDLKPANIALSANDDVKVLDFGLAKPMDGAGASSADLVDSPTLTSPALLTGAGVILGTAAYMSPEQAKGRAADKRSDVWAFGCVLYEMLTGRRAFGGEDVTDTLAAVLRGEPDWTRLPPDLPSPVHALLRGCLEKGRRERIGDLSTALFLLKDPGLLSPPPAVNPGAVSPPVWKRVLPLAAGLALGAAIVGSVFFSGAAGVGRAPERGSVARFELRLPETQRFTESRRAVTVSPDGTRVVYAADGRLFLRSLSDLEPRPIPGADPGVEPVFSPDGQSLVYWANGVLKRIAATGGVAVAICEIAPAPVDIAWAEQGIFFATLAGGVLRVSPSGGAPETVVAMKPAEGVVSGAQLLPDGHTLLYSVAQLFTPSSDAWDKARIVVRSLKNGSAKTVLEGGSSARYVPTGHIVYVVGATLFAVPFDVETLELRGPPVPVVSGVRRVAFAGGIAQFAFSDNGTLSYIPGPAQLGHEDVFVFDRQGNAQALALPRGSYRYPRVSPDGRRIALETTTGKETAIAVYDLSGRSSIRRLTFGGNNRYPVWSPDNRRIAFQSDRDGDRAVFWQPVDGGPAERLTRPERGESHVPESWSPQGDVLLINVATGQEMSLQAFSLQERKAVLFAGISGIRSGPVPTNAVFSPDGRWVAYQEPVYSGTGETSLFVQPFPPSGAIYEIAQGGRPVWSRDGTELFYIPAPNQLVVVRVNTKPSFSFTNPVSVPRLFGLSPPGNPRTYDVLPDGRLVGVAPAAQAQTRGPTPAAMHVVLNWFEELKERVPVR